MLHPDSKKGFTLVEVSLALLVVGLGMLAVFGLFTSGLNMNKRSTDEMRAAMFAEEVLNGYRAKVDASPGQWNFIGPPYDTNDPVLEATAWGMWINGASINISTTSGKPASQKPVLIRYIDWNTNLSYAVRFTLDFSNCVPVITNRLKFARLRVAAGEFGPADFSDATEFYTEFYNFAMPP